MRRFCILAGLALAAIVINPCRAAADDAVADATADTADTITVWGVRPSQIGSAFSATEGLVELDKFEGRPLLRTGEIVEVVPGLAATQHSGTGKANQYFLRGFNLDHGTDFSVALDGMPLNLRTHAHGQGYLDLNLVVPELVGSIAYSKGPYAAESGDFSLAGAARLATLDRLDRSFLKVEAGSFGQRSALVAARAGDRGYAAFSFASGDGPWETPERLRKYDGYARYNLGDVALSAGGYAARWTSTDQIPQRAIDAGAIGLFGDIDPTDGGVTKRFFVNAFDDKGSTKWNVWAQRYTLDLYSNFTYFVSDPVNGDQFQQADRRWISGGAAQHEWRAPGAVTPRVGAEFRFDDIGRVGLYPTRARERGGVVREDSVRQLSGAFWADATAALGVVRVNAGLRLDAMRAAVDSDDPRNSNAVSDALVSPKISLAWRAAPALEFYASAGRGFHSNDARGATSTIDPSTGDAVERAPLLVEGTGAELGARYEVPGFAATLALWGLDLDSELVFAGDSGASEASGATRRGGVEALATWSPARWLTLDASAAWTRARFRDAPGQSRVPLAADYVVTGGATIRPLKDMLGVVTFRRIGPAPLIEDNSARSRASTVVNARLAYTLGPATLALDVLNVFDSRDNDITYFYTSRLPGEPAAGVDDFHIHPLEPRAVRGEVRLRF